MGVIVAFVEVRLCDSCRLLRFHRAAKMNRLSEEKRISLFSSKREKKKLASIRMSGVVSFKRHHFLIRRLVKFSCQLISRKYTQLKLTSDGNAFVQYAQFRATTCVCFIEVFSIIRLP